MAIETRTMTASQARDFARLHQLQVDIMGDNVSRAAAEAVLLELGIPVLTFIFGGPIGKISSVLYTMFDLADRSNNELRRSNLIGAREAFYEIASFLEGNSSYVQAEVEQVWIPFPNTYSQTKLVQGVQSNPSQGYRILRVLLNDGRWIGQ